MITLIRYWIYKSKEIKWKCALWQFLDKELTIIAKNPEEIEKKLLPYIVDAIHASSEAMKSGQELGLK